MKKVLRALIISLTILFSLLIFLAFILPSIVMKNSSPTFNYNLERISTKEPYNVRFFADNVNIKGAAYYRIIYELKGKEKTTALTKLGDYTDYIKVSKDILKIPIVSIEIYNENKDKCLKEFKDSYEINAPYADIYYSEPQLDPSKKTKRIELGISCNVNDAIYYKLSYKLGEKEETTVLTLIEYTSLIEVPMDMTQLPITTLEIYGENKEKPIATFKGFDDIELTESQPEK